MSLFGGITENLLPGLWTQPLTWLECALAVLLVFLMRRRAGTLSRQWDSLSRHGGAVTAVFALLLVALHAAAEPRRTPRVHDEFAYLLSARTFLEGRVTNPTPVQPQSFEAIHINLTPSYNAMYPPGQGLTLAAGWRLFGDPLLANWAGAASLAWVTWWMLAGWLPRRWALLGGCLAGLRFGVFGYWAETLMCGWLPAACGLLYAGAAGRFSRRPDWRFAVLAGLGLAGLFSCRPFESVILSVASMPLFWRLRTRRKGALPGLAVAVLGISMTLAYNVPLTGSPFVFGYDLNMKHHGYGVFPGSPMTPSEPPATAHLAAFYEGQREFFRWGWSPMGFAGTRIKAVGLLWAFFIGPLLSLGLIGIRNVWRHPLKRSWLWIALLSCLGLLLNPWFFPHYYAAGSAWLWLILITGFRVWGVRSRGVPALLTATALAVVLVRAAAGPASIPAPVNPHAWLPYNTPPGNDARAELQRRLDAQPGPSAVFVRYGAAQSVYDDWVANAPLPSGEKVIWVNDLGAELNARLLLAYPGRKAWCVDVESNKPNLAEGPCSAAR